LKRKPKLRIWLIKNPDFKRKKNDKESIKPKKIKKSD
jgi:hypothetical protein